MKIGDSTFLIDNVKKLTRLVDDHEKWRTGKCLNLIASENFGSPKMRSFLSTDLSNRYSARDLFYRGTKDSDEIEALCVSIAKKLYRCKFADVRPISGHTCSMIVFMSLLRPKDSVVTCPPEFGGYPGTSELGLGPLLSVRNLHFPYDPMTMNIIPDQARKMISSENPKLTMFGSSFVPFPYEIEESIPAGYSGYTIYDGSHVMGLIAGREFQDPLSQGCSLLIGSTHKTLFGPQGGIILSNDELVFSKVTDKIFPGIVDNFHINRVAALAFALLELLKFGRVYATQVMKNSKYLAKCLDESGVEVKCKEVGYTKSHQVLLGYGEKRSIEIANLLESRDIITDVGIRIGTSEVTRRGMKEKEMEVIAKLIVDTIKRRRSKEHTKREVHRLACEFGGIEYSI